MTISRTREQDTAMLCRLAQEVFGYGMRIVEPDFMKMYQDPRVYCFFRANYPYWSYTYDPNNQAMLHRNGVDGEYAPTLPSWLDNIEDAISLLYEMEGRHGASWQIVQANCDEGCNPAKKLYAYRVAIRHGTELGEFTCDQRYEIPFAIAAAVLQLLDNKPSLRRQL